MTLLPGPRSGPPFSSPSRIDAPAAGLAPVPLAAGLGLTPEQVRVLVLVAVPLAVAPAIVVAGHARSSDHVDHWLAWTLLVAFTSLLGLVAYWEHCVIQGRRGEGNGEGPSDGSGP